MLSYRQSIDKFLGSLSYDDSSYVLCDLLMYEKNLVKELTEVEFEGLKVLAPKNYEQCLSMYYGNWRALPPESERVPKHDFIDLDFNKSYWH